MADGIYPQILLKIPQKSTLSTALLAILVLGGCETGPEPATLVIRGARVVTFDETQPEAQALAISRNRIVAIGARKEIEPLIDASTEVVGLDGGLVLPGFNDSHIHLLSRGLTLFEVDLFNALSLEDIQQEIRTFAGKNPDEEWILGAGWRYTAMPDGRLPTRQDLDAVVSDRPAFMRAYDGHSAWVNTKALELAGSRETRRSKGSARSSKIRRLASQLAH